MIGTRHSILVRGRQIQLRSVRTGVTALIMEPHPFYGPCELSCTDRSAERAVRKLKLFAALCDRHGHDFSVGPDRTLEEMEAMV